jgi:LPS sulfotransferase NodH
MATEPKPVIKKPRARREVLGDSPLAEKFDIPFNGMPHLKYFVAFVPRSGSTFLSTQLWKSGSLGAPLEYLNSYYDLIQLVRRFEVDNLEEYLNEIVKHRTTPNGVFGLKISRAQFQFFRQIEFAHELRPQHWIFIDRKDKHAQAVSLDIAIQTRAWSSRNRSMKKPQYRFNKIRQRFDRLNREHQFWDRFFASSRIEPVRIDYEDFLLDPDGHVARILKLWDVPSEPAFSPIVPEITRQRTPVTEDWTSRFREELNRAPIQT